MNEITNPLIGYATATDSLAQAAPSPTSWLATAFLLVRSVLVSKSSCPFV
jgi:hypothetical protein